MGWSHLDSLGASDGQLICWQDDVYEGNNELMGEFLLSIKLTHSSSGHSFTISSIYGPSDDARRSNF